MTRASVWYLTFIGTIAGGAAHAGCSAGSDAGFGGTHAGNSGQGAEGGALFTGTGGSGNAPACEDPTCIGNTPQGNCDSGLGLESDDAMDAARAIGLCQVAQPGTWGVISAEWVRSDGQPLVGGDGGPLFTGTDLTKGRGLVDHFGAAVAPREGAKMLAISSGSARNPGEPGYADPSGNWKDSQPHGAPPSYPKESPSCPGVQTGEPYDSAGLRLTIRTPTDAKSFTFDFDFYTYEYPDYICTEYNDFFVAMLSPTVSSLPDGNISFDNQGNTISVNAGFLEACNPCSIGPKVFDCALGYGEITGTGFDSNTQRTFDTPCPGLLGSAATSWLVTTAPVENPGGEITLHFTVWDSGDGVLDSTVLIDNFRFELGEGSVGTAPIPR